MTALLAGGIKVFFVTHLYEFGRSYYEQARADALFLRAERGADGRRSFRLTEGEPLETSYGEDLYHRIFATDKAGPLAAAAEHNPPA